MGTAEYGRGVQDDPLAQHFRRGSTARGSGAGIECAARGEIVTTKDHAKLAAALSAAFQIATTTGQAHGVRLAANSIVLVLEKDNPKFDRNKFEKALASLLPSLNNRLVGRKFPWKREKRNDGGRREHLERQACCPDSAPDRGLRSTGRPNVQ